MTSVTQMPEIGITRMWRHKVYNLHTVIQLLLFYSTYYLVEVGILLVFCLLIVDETFSPLCL